MYNWNWAVKQLQYGKKVRNNLWVSHPKGYWVLKNGRIVTNEGQPPSIQNNFIGNNWELYEEKLMLSDLKVGDRFKLRCTGGDNSIFTLLSTSEDARIALNYCYVMNNHLYHSSVDLLVEKVND